MEKLHFKVSSGLKDIIGRDLITNELVAIFELVKNGYDADATEINLIINSYENSIIIQDNGKGMSRYDIENKWLFVAHSEKKDSDRVYAGSMGIGRFSFDRLGSKLTLFTKKEDELNELIIDWGDFEKNSLDEFEKMEVSFRSGSEVREKITVKSGTILKITDLRDDWTKERVNKVVSALQRLVNPFVDDGRIKINVKYLSSSTGIAELDVDVSNNIATVLDKKTIYIECIIEEKEISISLFDKEKVIYSFTFENSTILNNIYFKIYYLSFAAKNNFTRIMGTEAKNYGSIFLYKNNFRIFPYGETDYDAFGLNLRKTQGYNRYLGHRELLGWINITDSENHFNEVTSRDRGFVTNAFTVAFEELYMEFIQRPLESYVQLVKFGNSEIDEIGIDDQHAVEKLTNRFKKYNFTVEPQFYELPKVAQPLERKIQLLNDKNLSSTEKQEIQKSVEHSAKALTRENREVKKEKKQVEKENIRLKREVSIKEVILAEKNPDRQDLLFHELGKVGKELDSSVNALVEYIGDFEESVKLKFLNEIKKIRKSSDKLASIKTQLLRISSQSLSEKILVELKAYLESYFSIISDENSINIELDTSGKPLNKEINVYDFGVVLDNLIINAVERDASKISIFFESDNSAMHFISDTGPLGLEIIENIFNLGFTTKTYSGTGIGMYLCKEICKEFGWNITVTSIGNLVDFRIEFGD